MSRKTERNKIKKEIKKQGAKPWQKFEEIDIALHRPIPPGMTRAFKNNRYTVMVYDNAMTTHGKAVKAIIVRHDKQPIHEFKRVQLIKTEIFGPESLAIQYYPIASPVKPDVYPHSITLWIFPAGNVPIPAEDQWISEDIEASQTVDLMQSKMNEFMENINKARDGLAKKMATEGMSPALYGLKENIVLSDDGLSMRYECAPTRLEVPV